VPDYYNPRIADIDRGISEALRYYGGPLGEQVINAANFAQMFNPVTAIGNAMQGAKAAANPDRAPMERVKAGIESLAETASVAAPIGAAGIMARAPRIPGRWVGGADDAAGALEEAIVGTSRVRDAAEGMSRRQFLQRGGAAGALAAAGVKLPSEELLGRAATKVAADVPPLSQVAAKVRAGREAFSKSRLAADELGAEMMDRARKAASPQQADELMDGYQSRIDEVLQGGSMEEMNAFRDSAKELAEMAGGLDPRAVEDLPEGDLLALRNLIVDTQDYVESMIEHHKMLGRDEALSESEQEWADLLDETRTYMGDENVAELLDAVEDRFLRWAAENPVEIPF